MSFHVQDFHFRRVVCVPVPNIFRRGFFAHFRCSFPAFTIVVAVPRRFVCVYHQCLTYVATYQLVNYRMELINVGRQANYRWGCPSFRSRDNNDNGAPIVCDDRAPEGFFNNVAARICSGLSHLLGYLPQRVGVRTVKDVREEVRRKRSSGVARRFIVLTDGGRLYFPFPCYFLHFTRVEGPVRVLRVRVDFPSASPDRVLVEVGPRFYAQNVHQVLVLQLQAVEAVVMGLVRSSPVAVQVGGVHRYVRVIPSRLVTNLLVFGVAVVYVCNRSHTRDKVDQVRYPINVGL